LLFRTNVNSFFHSGDFSLFICPVQDVADFFLIETGLFHQGGRINPFSESFDD